ncbi:MAG TPA: hypothetical protein VHY76_12205 [Acetobacteraceae bacterium]|nr:hypothetical protein [Acetobacteraceae bacterium]
MRQPSTRSEIEQARAFRELVGARKFRVRLAEIGRLVRAGQRAGRSAQQRFAIELAIGRLRRGAPAPSTADRRIAALAGEAVRIASGLSAAGGDRLVAALRAGMTGEATLVPAFHLLRTAALQRARGFAVRHAGLEDGAAFDLLIRRDGMEAEIACDVVSAEDGRDVHRGAWFSLIDRIDPELQRWLSDHPGRYLLKMTLPQGLRAAEAEALGTLHRRITALLSERRRADHDEAAVLRLDPLLLAGAQADELGLVSRLRREFGPEAHLAVTTAGGGVFVMAARAGRENEVAVAVRRRLCGIAPARLSGARPGILAMFVEDTDRLEWQALRERLELEGEARQFLTCKEARPVVAVTCASRLELFGLAGQQPERDGEIRFRNPTHPAARAAALAPAILSSV